MKTKKCRINRIACVQLETKLPDFCKFVIMPRYGLPVIGSILNEAGYEVKIFIEHIAKPDKDWILSADALLLSSFTGAANRTHEFADWFRQKSDAPIILGGEHGSSFTEEALEWADYVIRGEGDDAILELISALNNGRNVDGISALSYKLDNKIHHNAITHSATNINVVHDLDLIHEYPKENGLKLFLKKRKTKLICVQSTRGCPFNCGFCVTPRLFNYSYRYREVESVIEDIKIKLPYGNDFLFTDNLFAFNIEKTEQLLNRMLEEGFGQKAQFTCFSRVEISKHPDLLKKMYLAGFRYICLGLESINNKTLNDIDKRQTISDIVQAVKAINESGIKVSSSFIAGNDEDYPGALLNIADFAIENNIFSLHFISLWYYPGDPRCPIQLQRLIIPTFDYCNGSFVTHFPMNMRPSTLQRELVQVQRKFWNHGRALKSAFKGKFNHAIHMMTHRYAYRIVEKYQLDYAAFLESIEGPYYDDRERLLLDKILDRPIDPLVLQAYRAGNIKLDSKPAKTKGKMGAYQS